LFNYDKLTDVFTNEFVPAGIGYISGDYLRAATAPLSNHWQELAARASMYLTKQDNRHFSQSKGLCLKSNIQI